MRKQGFLGRGIHNEEFKSSLLEGKLKKMLDVVVNDVDLDVQIRNNYLNIYYKGGSIAKVKSEKRVVFDKYYFYLNMKSVPTNAIKDNKLILADLNRKKDALIRKFIEGNYEEYFIDAKKTIKKWLKENPKAEREEQHKLSIENKYGKSDYTILDLEYQVSTRSEFACTFIPKGKNKPKKPRFDIIAVNKTGELCVIELKKGSDALRNISGLKEHWDCYNESIGRNYNPFVEEMKNLLKQKQDFGLIDSKVKIINSVPEFMFAYSYENPNAIEKECEKFDEEYRKIGENIPVIKLTPGSFKLIN